MKGWISIIYAISTLILSLSLLQFTDMVLQPMILAIIGTIMGIDGFRVLEKEDSQRPKPEPIRT